MASRGKGSGPSSISKPAPDSQMEARLKPVTSSALFAVLCTLGHYTFWLSGGKRLEVNLFPFF